MTERPPHPARLLVIAKTPEEREVVAAFLASAGHEVSASPCREPALDVLSDEVFDVVVLSACACGEEGLYVLARAKSQQCCAQFILLAGDAECCTAVEAMRMGAFDYLARPVDGERLLLSVERALEQISLRREVASLRRRSHERTRGGLVGESEAMRRVYDLMERVAPTSLTVLVTGETGTGKELVARGIHELSPRSSRPYVPVSCSALPESLLESELFGHVRGSFTGAVATRKGLLEEGQGGTAFLDEIETLGPATQAKLLRVMEDRTIQRVGDRHDIPIDVRLVAATNADLAEAVRERGFREDLFYRLNVFPIALPPLRDRRADIPLLAVHFRDEFARHAGLPRLEITPEGMDRLMRHDWPGNVRELKHAIERAMVVSMERESIEADGLVPGGAGGGRSANRWAEALREGWTLDRLEREYTAAVLDSTRGHRGRAAEILGIDRRTLYRRLRRSRSSRTSASRTRPERKLEAEGAGGM